MSNIQKIVVLLKEERNLLFKSTGEGDDTTYCTDKRKERKLRKLIDIAESML